MRRRLAAGSSCTEELIIARHINDVDVDKKERGIGKNKMEHETRMPSKRGWWQRHKCNNTFDLGNAIQLATSAQYITKISDHIDRDTGLG
jgi:hypothetical protein